MMFGVSGCGIRNTPSSVNPPKVIILDGLPGGGKTTSSKFVRDFLGERGIKNILYGEDHGAHPIRDWERDGGHILSMTPSAYKAFFLKRWKDFVAQAQHQSKVMIFESCLLQEHALSLALKGEPAEGIAAFIAEIVDILSPLHPAIFYLNQDNVSKQIKAVYKTRDQKWRDKVLETGELYKRSRSVSFGAPSTNSLESFIDLMEDAKRSHDLVMGASESIYMIDNTDRDWTHVEQALQDLLGSFFAEEKSIR